MSTTCSSPPVIGGHSFSPNGGFASPRSYYNFIRVGWINASITQFDNRFVGGGTFTPPTAWEIIVDPRFYDWSSNNWTIDHVVCESYYLRLLTGEKIPAPFGVSRYIDPVSFEVGLYLSNLDALMTNFASFDTPPAPPGYWLSE